MLEGFDNTGIKRTNTILVSKHSALGAIAGNADSAIQSLEGIADNTATMVFEPET
jgi:hypothetical protein